MFEKEIGNGKGSNLEQRLLRVSSDPGYSMVVMLERVLSFQGFPVNIGGLCFSFPRFYHMSPFHLSFFLVFNDKGLCLKLSIYLFLCIVIGWNLRTYIAFTVSHGQMQQKFPEMA